MYEPKPCGPCQDLRSLLPPERGNGEDAVAAQPGPRRDGVAPRTKAQDLVAKLVRSALEDAALSNALAKRLQDLQERRRRLERRTERRRDIALRIMGAFALRRIEAPDFTVARRLGAPRLEVTAEAAIADLYWLPQPPKLDRTALLRALKSGEDVDGVTLAPPRIELHVRTR